MTKYIENVNAYLSKMKIKQTYISMKTGIDTKKLSRIMTGAQDITSMDMEKIAQALGKKPEFFMSEEFYVPEVYGLTPERIAFYAGNPTSRQEDIAEKLVELVENLDVVMGAKDRFLNIARE
ncbi:MAG: helix-turn-helix domain-containing protein [Clostridiales bacterium]|nr:helix-turn-helix domain-containing protein [Clostridiales bacterium]